MRKKDFQIGDLLAATSAAAWFSGQLWIYLGEWEKGEKEGMVPQTLKLWSLKSQRWQWAKREFGLSVVQAEQT